MEAVKNLAEKVTGSGDAQQPGVTDSAAVSHRISFLRQHASGSRGDGADPVCSHPGLLLELENSQNLVISPSKPRSTVLSVFRPIWSENQKELLFKKDKTALTTTSLLARYVPSCLQLSVGVGTD
jgi:hypothetical protein